MANIKLTLPAEPFSKQIVTFTAPCGCDQVTDGLIINGETYTVCDAMGECVTGKGGAWCAGAQVSVVLDCENKKAYIQNAAVPDAAPAGYVTQTIRPSTFDELHSSLDTVINSMSDASVQFIRVVAAGAGFGSFTGAHILRVYRHTANYAQVTAFAYGVTSNGSSVVEYNSKCGGVWQDWSANVNTGNIAKYAAPAALASAEYTVTTLDELHSTLNTVISSMSNGTAKFIRVIMSKGFAPFYGGTHLMKIHRHLATYSQVTAEGYANAANGSSVVFYNSTAAGTWQEWTQGLNTGNMTSLGCAQIQTGTYTGTGTYGSSNKNSLTFSFVPKMVLVQLGSTGTPDSDAFIWCGQSTGTIYYNGHANQATLTFALSGTTLTWYSTDSYGEETAQLNSSGTVYRWVALG